MDEPGWHDPSNWIGFVTAAAAIEKRLDCSRTEARTRLRRAFIDEELTPKKAPYEEIRGFIITFLPVEQWSSIAPSEWRKREVDYDDRDADGCEVMTMIYEKTFGEWLARQEIGKHERSGTRAGTPRSSARRVIKALFPNGIDGISNRDIILKVGAQLKAQGQTVPSSETILRAADRRK
jgi:hypothetical protein